MTLEKLLKKAKVLKKAILYFSRSGRPKNVANLTKGSCGLCSRKIVLQKLALVKARHFFLQKRLNLPFSGNFENISRTQFQNFVSVT